MADKKFSGNSVMWRLLNGLTERGMFRDMEAKSAYEAVQQLVFADEEYDKALKEFAYRGSAFERVELAKIRRRNALRAIRSEP